MTVLTRDRVADVHSPATALPVLVGVDGSPSSKAALSWAARYAAMAGLPLRVILAWRIRGDASWTFSFPSDWDPQADAKSVLQKEVKEVLGPTPGADVSALVVEGPPARVLADASESASLIVVGSRGHGEFTGMLLGSVSEFLTTHAHCPVVVVRDKAKVAHH